MDKAVLKGFADEMQKQALLPRFLLKAMSPIKGWRAGVKGEKSMIRQVDREVKKIKFKDPGFDAASYRVTRLEELQTTGAEVSKKILEKGKIPAGQSFVSKHKKKLLVGGAAVGGLYLATSSNEKGELRRKRLAATRNFQVPRRVYYQ